jgi:hypothetical protein
VTTAPTTPQKSKGKEPQPTNTPSPDDKTSVVTESTINPLDPLRKQKHLNYFLTKTPQQQHEAIEGNPCYLSSLIDWKESLEDTDDFDEDHRVLLPWLPHIKRLITHAQEHFQGLAQKNNQLQATNRQLQEENNRLSTRPEPKHKDPAFSKLQQDHQELVNTHNELITEYAKFKPLFEAHSWIKNPTALTEYILQTEKELQEAATQGAFDTEDLTGQLRDWEQVGKALLREPYNPDTYQPDPEKAKEHAKQLVQALAAATTLAKQNQEKLNQLQTSHRRLSDHFVKTGMASSSKERPSGMFTGNLTQEQCEFIWNQIPSTYRRLPPGQGSPTTSEELVNALISNIHCLHPREAAVALGDQSGNQEWEASIEQMEEAANHICPGLQTAAINAGSSLFKVSEIPEFSDTKEYERYRSQLQRFLRAHGAPRRPEYGQALERILQAFTATTAKIAAETWTVDELIRPTWAETTEALLQALDEKFEDNNLLEAAQVKWYQTKLKDGDDINDFFNRYEAAADRYLLAQKRKRIPAVAQVSTAVVNARLIQIIPAYLRNALKLRLSSQGVLLETMTLKQLRPELEDLWRYMPKPAAIGHNTNTRFQTAAGRNANLTPAQQAKEPKTYACGFHGNYDTQPQVPMHLRGSIFPNPREPSKDTENLRRRQQCATQGLCINCRRPRDQHQTNGTNYRPITLQANTRRAPAQQIEAPHPTGQLAIEAPPEVTPA